MCTTALVFSLLFVVANSFEFGGDVYFTYVNKSTNSGLRIIYKPENLYARGKGEYYVGMYHLNAFINIKESDDWTRLAWTHHGDYFYKDVVDGLIHPGKRIIYSIKIYKPMMKSTGGMTLPSLIYEVIDKVYITPSTIEHCDAGLWEYSFKQTRCDAVIAQLAHTTGAPPATTQPQGAGTMIAVGVTVGAIALVVLVINIIVCVKKEKCCSKSRSPCNIAAGRTNDGTGSTTGQSPTSSPVAAYTISQAEVEIAHSASRTKTYATAELQNPPTYASLFPTSSCNENTDVNLRW